MALSNSVNWSVDRDTMIKTSMQYMGALGIGETPTTTDYTENSILINMLVKHLQADDIQLWIRKYGYILPHTSVSSVDLGADGDNVADSYVRTTLSADAASGASSVTVASATGISAGTVGIELDNGEVQWTTISAPSGSSLPLLGDTLDAAATTGNNVYAYQTKVTRPTTILDAFRRQSSDNIDTPLVRLTESGYNNLSDKTTESVPIQWFYDETLNFGASTAPGNGKFYFWPRWEDGKSVIVIRYTKPFDDLDASTNDFEFPQMWYLPIMLGLSWLLANKYGLPIKERDNFYQQFLMTKTAALAFDQEDGSLFISPSYEKG